MFQRNVEIVVFVIGLIIVIFAAVAIGDMSHVRTPQSMGAGGTPLLGR